MTPTPPDGEPPGQPVTPSQHFNVKFKVTTKRVMVAPDGTRTVVADDAARVGRLGGATIQRRNIVGMLSVLGALGLVGAGIRDGRSDAAARIVYESSPSCALRYVRPRGSVALDSSATPADGAGDSVPPAGACHVEQATISALDRTSGKGGMRYRMSTVQETGARDRVSLGSGSTAARFWGRMKPTGIVRIQRFVAPGYHLSGRVAAVADSAGGVVSLDSPARPGHPNGVNILLGSLLLITGLLFLRRPRESST
jgi:hypothetical protein